MLWKIILGVTECFAVGAMFTVLIMELAHKQICKQKSLSEYYFDLPHWPVELQSAVFTETVFRWILYVLFFLTCFELVYICLYIYVIQYPDTYLKIFESVDETMQNGINILFPSTVTIVVIFATFKKPYYILFSTNDVITRYKIHSLMQVATITWCLGTVLQVIICILPISEIFIITVYSAIFLFQVTCFLFCLIVLINSFRICLSSKKTELKILDMLYVSNPSLHYIDLNEAANIDVINEYLINQLKQKTKRAKNPLKKCTNFFCVEFWSAASKSPLPHKRQILFQLFLLAIWAIFFGFMTICTLSALIQEFKWEIPFFLQNDHLVFAVSVATSCITIFLFGKKTSLCQMRRAYFYGQWGYCFFDLDGCPQYYFPRHPMYWSPSTTRWLRAVLNLITLFHIEYTNKCYQKLLEKLYKTWLEIKTEDSVDYFVFTLVLCLCLRLIVETHLFSSDEKIAKMQTLQREILENFPQGKLLDSWINAIWVDIQRDPKWYQENQSNKVCST